MPNKARSRSGYMDLIAEFPLKVIHNDTELRKAEKVTHRLIDAVKLTRDERDYLDVLAQLIEAYEEKHHPIPDAPPEEMLKFLIENKKITQRELALSAGIPVSTISELLSAKREFTKNHIERLSAYFKVSPAVFMPAHELVPA